MYYDTPKPRIMNALSLNSNLVMQFLGDVLRMDGHILLNIIASHCYLNSSYDRRIGLYIKEDNGKVLLENGLEIELEGSVNVHVKITISSLMLSH